MKADVIIDKAPARDSKFNDKPKVFTTFDDGVIRPLTDISREALDIIVSNNDNFYHTRRSIGRIEKSETDIYYIRLLDVDSVYGYLTDTCNFIRVKIDNKGNEDWIHIQPQKRLATNICKYHTYDDIRKLRGIYHHPILTENGKIDFSLGYNSESKSFIAPESHFEIVDMSVDEAKNILLDLVFDFQFKNEASMFMALSLPLTMICRQYINGPVPIFGFIGQSGAGKTLLVQTMHNLVSGQSVQERQAPHTNAEWNKSVFTALLSGHELIYFDNVNRRDQHGDEYTFESNALASATTSGNYTDRILGLSEERSVEVNSTFAISGIDVNFHISKELLNRTVFIELYENEMDTSGFRHQYLCEYVEENRAKLMSAYIALINNWIEKGKPRGKSYINRFERWSSLIFGIWDAADVDTEITRPEIAKEIDSVASADKLFREFMSDGYRYDKTATESVKSIVKYWEKATEKIGVNPELISGQKRNKIISELFPNARYITTSDSSGKSIKAWKGLAIIE